LQYFLIFATQFDIIYLILFEDKTMKKTYYESLYILDVDALEEDEQNNLLMCGSQNWDYYFHVNSEQANVETFSNVSIVEFENIDDFKKFVNSNQIIDYSLEHDNPMVLVYGKD
jgi:hypothetical protein